MDITYLQKDAADSFLLCIPTQHHLMGPTATSDIEARNNFDGKTSKTTEASTAKSTTESRPQMPHLWVS